MPHFKFARIGKIIEAESLEEAKAKLATPEKEPKQVDKTKADKEDK